MCRTPALVATVLAVIAAPALAVETPKGVKPAVPVAAPTASQAASTPVKATPQQRAEASRLDAFARAAFWASQLEIDGRDIEAGLGMTQALRQMGRFDEAAEAAGRVLVMAPDNADVLLEAARAHIGRGQGFYAIEPAKKAQALAPRDWRPVSLLAVATEQAGREDEALGYHRQALALAPAEPAVLANMGMYYAGHGELPRAEQMLRQAVATGRADAKVRQNLALVIGLQGRVAEAEQLVRQDLPPEQAANNIAWLKAATERAPTAQGRSWESLRASGS